jgi:segregation and condensation protein A
MDIYNIKIYDITTQYLEYLKNMEDIDLEITSEFIVIAATLLEIKSKLLLPKEDKEVTEEEENDPRKDLINKLLEYKKFKLVASFLREKEKTAGILYSKKPEIIEEKKEHKEDILKDITILMLFNIYNDLINKYYNKMNTENVIDREIHIDKFRIEDKMKEISLRFNDISKLCFSQVIEECESKIEMVVTFLALLELIKLKAVTVAQEDNFKEIYVEEVKAYERE